VAPHGWRAVEWTCCYDAVGRRPVPGGQISGASGGGGECGMGQAVRAFGQQEVSV